MTGWDWRGIKRTIERVAPPGHPIRQAIAAEPDFMPREEGLVRAEVYARLAATLPTFG